MNIFLPEVSELRATKVSCHLLVRPVLSGRSNCEMARRVQLVEEPVRRGN